MSFPTLLVLAASLTTMKAAIDRGDVDEASRQGVLAGTAVVESALGNADRATVLAGIAAAPFVEARGELLLPLAELAAGPDRRIAIPAATAAAQIARELVQSDASDDLSSAELIAWRDRWVQIALERSRWIEVRVLAVDVAARVDRTLAAYAHDPQTLAANTHGAGIALTSSLADPDPAFRLAALAELPMPLPVALRGSLAKAVVDDADPHVALAAVAGLCADLAFDEEAPILDALGTAGILRMQELALTPAASPGALREAMRCLAADGAPKSNAAVRAIRARLR